MSKGKAMKKIVMVILYFFAISGFAADFSFHDLDGKKITVENVEGNLLFKDARYANKPVLIFFFGTRCPFCEQEIPHVNKLFKKGSINVIGVQAQIAIDDERLEEFANEEDMDFPILRMNDGNRFVRYLKKRGLWIGGVPYYIWIDKYGNLEPVDLDTVRERLEF